MERVRFDTIVIGSGPAGEGAAMQLVKSGQRVAVVERHREVGGGCTHWGTIPSKALRHAVQQLADYRNRPLFRSRLGYIDISYAELLQSAVGVMSQQVAMRRTFYFRNRVEVIHGHARFVAPTTVEVINARGVGELYEADNIVVATG